jgi:hypothetical protein
MQRGLKLENHKAVLYNTAVVRCDNFTNEIKFDTGGWVTQSTRKAINTWLATYRPRHCIRVRTIKFVMHVELTALDGVVERYPIHEPITIDLNNVQTKEY